MDIRRIALRGLVAAPLVVGGTVATFLWLPKLVRQQVAARLQARTGLSARIGSVSVGLTSLTLRDLVVGERADQPSIRAATVELDAGPIGLALRGSRALDDVRVSDLRVRVPAHTRATHDLLQHLLERKNGEPSTSSRVGPALHIDRLAIDIRDESGSLVRVSGARASVDGKGARLDIERVRAGELPSSTAELERISVQATRGPKGLRLRRVTVAKASVHLTERVQMAEPEPPSGAVAATAADRSTLRRVLAMVRSLTHPQTSPAPSPGASSGAKTVPPDGRSAVFERLSDDAVLELRAASVVQGASGAPILQGLTTTLKMQSGRALSLVASGKAQGGGVISCDLIVRPEELRADGQVKLSSLPLSLIAPFLPNVPWYEPELGRVDAELVIKTEPARGIAFSGEARLREGAISAARIAPTPVRDVNVALNGRGRFLPLQHRLEIEQAELDSNGAALRVTGAVEWSSDHYLFDIDATLPATACTKALRSVPEDLLGDMSLASFTGKFGGHLRLKLDSRQLDDAELVIAPEDHCDFVTVPAMADLRRFRVPFIHSVVEPDGALFEMETGPGTSAWTFLEDISPFFVHAVLAHEDAGFFSHHGFSPHHIRDALVRNLKEGRYVVGASTITMQLVKNVFLHREKTLARKIQEVLLTWWIERVMEKRDIIELYLNVIEYGPSVYGIRNAAKHYFNRLPSQLSPAESVYLATILPNPKAYHMAFQRGSPSPGTLSEMRKMLARMRARNWYSAEAVEYGLKEVENFHFAPEGTIVPSRQIPGTTAPLPYMQAFAQQPGWGDDSESTKDDNVLAAPAAREKAKHAPTAPASR